MQLWLSKNSEVPLKEQIVTQLILGIVSSDLKAGQRLPSTQEVSRRFRVHANTVSAAYRDLVRRNWLTFRKGSGFYVNDRAQEVYSEDLALDHMIRAFFQEARSKGYKLQQIQHKLKDWLTMQPPDHLLVIEEDRDLRQILAQEIADATKLPVKTAESDIDLSQVVGAIPIAMYGRIPEHRISNSNIILLHSNSILPGMPKSRLITSDSLIMVISIWDEFLRWAKAILVAADLDPNCMSFRSAHDRDWQSGLTLPNTFVIADVVVGKQLPEKCRRLIFPIVSPHSLLELNNL